MSRTADAWHKHGLIYALAGQRDWRRSHTQLPIVDVAYPDRWRVYYSSRNDDGRSLPVCFDVEAGRPDNILADRTEPLLALGAPGCFDEHGVMPTAIIDVGAQKYLYYIGWSLRRSVPYQNAIGLAISDDGGHSFHKYSTGPIIAQNHVDPFFTGTFTVLRIDGRWHGWYMSCTEWRDVGGALEPRYLIKRAVSDDGIDWRRDGGIAIGYRSDDEGGIAGATVHQDSDGFSMWYACRKDRDYRSNRDNSYRIGHAISKDAIAWERRDDCAGIDVSDDGWDSEMICYPCVVPWNDTLYLFYNGNGFGRSGIGYATRRRARGQAQGAS